MKIMSAVVIGDIHYPKYKNLKALDLKNSATPAAMKNALASSSMSLIVDDVVRLANSSDVDCILLAGDFTDGGCLNGFCESIQFLNNALSSIKVPKFGVPGNHDLDYPHELSDNDQKFVKFLDKTTSIPNDLNISFESGRCRTGELNVSGIEIFSLNSCLVVLSHFVMVAGR